MAFGCVEQFGGELHDHALFDGRGLVRATDRERGPTFRKDFEGNLVVRSAYAAGIHFEKRLAVLDGLLEELEGLVAALLLEIGHGGIEDALRGRLLAAHIMELTNFVTRVEL